MKTKDELGGVYSLLLTPFHEDQTVNWVTYEKYVEWQVSMGPAGLFAVCGTSEMKWLTLAERTELARLAVEHAGGLPVVATANLEADIQRHADEVLRVADTGVSGIVLVPPDGMGLDVSRLEDYFSRLIEESPVPVLIYEWPQVSPYLIPAEVFASLVNRAGLRGIKDTTCTIEGISDKIKAVPSQSATVFQANMPFLLESLDEGAGGIMAVVSSCFGDWVVDLWKSRHDEKEREAFHRRLLYLDLLLRMGYPATSKFLVQRRGIDLGLTTRWPVKFNKEALKALSIYMDHAQLHV